MGKQSKNALDYLQRSYNDIMSAICIDSGYNKGIVKDKVTDPNLHPISSKQYTLPLKHHKWVPKELEDLGKACIIKKSLCPCASSIAVPRKASHSSPLQETKTVH